MIEPSVFKVVSFGIRCLTRLGVDSSINYDFTKQA